MKLHLFIINFLLIVFFSNNSSAGNQPSCNGNFSYNHDYKWYAEESEIETVQCEIIRPYYPYEDFPTQKNRVHYFYSGKTT